MLCSIGDALILNPRRLSIPSASGGTRSSPAGDLSLACAAAFGSDYSSGSLQISWLCSMTGCPTYAAPSPRAGDATPDHGCCLVTSSNLSIANECNGRLLTTGVGRGRAPGGDGAWLGTTARMPACLVRAQPWGLYFVRGRARFLCVRTARQGGALERGRTTQEGSEAR